MSHQELSPILYFKDLSESDKEIVAKMIIETNELNISASKFSTKASSSFLILRKNKDLERFVSIGMKEVHAKLRKALVDNRPKFSHKLELQDSLVKFYSNLQKNELLERGWATNLTGIRGALSSLSEEFDTYLSKRGMSRSNSFCTVVSTNDKGRLSAERSGYTFIGDFDSPFSKNSLSLYIWLAK